MATSSDVANRRARASSRLQLQAALIGMNCAVIFLGLTNPFDKAGVNLLIGFIVFSLGCLPTWLWARGLMQNRVPVLALHALFYSVCFGLAGFLIPEHYIGQIRVSEGEYTPALLLTALGLLAMYGGYWAGLRSKWPIAPRFIDRDEAALNELAVTVVLPVSVAASLVAQQAGLSVLSNVLAAIRTFAFVWVLHLAFAGVLKANQRRVAVFVFVPIYLVLYSGLTGGALAGLLVFSQLIGLAYVAARKRLPIAAVAATLSLFFVLQPVKAEYRDRTWATGDRLSTIDGVALFARLAYEHMFLDSQFDLAESLADSYTRINHLHATAAVMADVRTYLGGETYLPLLTKWIPRALWPNKPREDLGNRWARELGYLYRNDYYTSFNLPWLPEMYLNFGSVGVVVGNVVVGFLMAGVWSVFAKRIRSSMGFAAGLVLCSSFFFPESNFSMDMGNLIVAAVSILALGFALTLYRPMESTRLLVHGLAE